MNIKLTLRLVLAVIFALTAFIFSELVPDLPPFSHTFLRLTITVWFGLMGFGLFPDIAKRVSLAVVALTNIITARVSSDVMSQLMRLPQQNPFGSPGNRHHVPLGGVSSNQPLILDTSAIIDGRIVDIAKTGFINGLFLLPTFILAELQQVADSPDYLKRSRARQGFEVIENLKKIKGLRLEIWDKEPAAKTVDDKLLKLAKNLSGRIITTDFNLNRVAQVSGIPVLNINDLANALKTIAVPGEELKVKIIHIGKDAKQGVGYLSDGTMIVVEDCADLVGKEINTQVTRMLQVPAGRMIFAKKTDAS